MKNKLLQFQQSDAIKASVQKEEIVQLIKDQKQKRQLQQWHFNRFSNSQQLTQRHKGVLRQTSFHIRRKSLKLKSTSESETQPVMERLEVEMREQMNYFSVKQDYEQIIKNTKDQRVRVMLKEELQPVMKPRYSLSSRNPKSCNFFEKVLNKENKIRAFVKRKPLSFTQREEGQAFFANFSYDF